MRRLAILLAVPLTVTAACAGTSGAAQATTTASHYTNWTTYHRSNDRAGYAPTGLTRPLRLAWRARLDGAVYGEPLMVRGTLIAATENDSVYGLAPNTGRVRWNTHLGSPESRSNLPCGDVDPLGITSTPAYDAATRSLFVLAETTGGHHTLWALNPTNGRRRWHRTGDVLPNRDRTAQQQRSALLVADGRVIVAYGGLYGDCGNYVGYVTSTATNGSGSTTHYEVPTAREAGIWSTAGPVIGQNGNVYVASGNGASTSGAWDGSDSVIELRPDSMQRVAAFAPSSWRQDNAADADLGSSSPVPVSGRILIAGKTGTVYLLRQSLGGVGGQLATASGCTAFGGAAHVGTIAVMPCRSGIRSLIVGKNSLRWKWSSSVYGSPVFAGAKLYVADPDNGRLEVLSLATGRVVGGISVGSLTHFPSEIVDGNHVFVPTLTGITAIRGS